MLEVKGLTKVFKSTKKKRKVVAVDNISFNAEAGEIFGLLGPNGAGKTTAIRVIATILKATSGTALVAGHDIVKNAETVRKNIGVLTTDIGLYDRFTARENLRYFGLLYGISKEKLEHRIDQLVSILKMEDFADRRAGKFSTGMKQKVAIARSIIHDPQVVIFDEPTAGLDVLASQTVTSFIKSSKEMGKLVILSTHRMIDAQKLCDRVAIMHRGKIISIDSVAKILEKTNSQDLEEAFVKLVGQEPDYDPEKEKQESKEQPSFYQKYFGKRFSIGRIIVALLILLIYYIFNLLKQ
ncbi:MAG: ATP-binding cassette domain-containing protein [Patescibacteria group bacterium]